MWKLTLIKPKINYSFQKISNNDYKRNQPIYKINSYNYNNKNNFNDISADQIKPQKIYHTSNRGIKNNKIHEIIININDGIDSLNN